MFDCCCSSSTSISFFLFLVPFGIGTVVKSWTYSVNLVLFLRTIKMFLAGQGWTLGRMKCVVLCVRQAINHLFFALPKRFLWCKGDNNIHGKQVQCFLAFCCLILFAVACCGRISSPILLRLCSELLAHELLFVMNYKKSLIVCLLLACWSRTYSANAVLCLQTINLLSERFVGNQAAAW